MFKTVFLSKTIFSQMASSKIISLQGVSKLVISMIEMAKACLVTLKSFQFDVLFSKMLVNYPGACEDLGAGMASFNGQMSR